MSNKKNKDNKDKNINTKESEIDKENTIGKEIFIETPDDVEPINPMEV